MIIANNCAFLADGMFSISGNDLSMYMAWLGLLAYTFQIYFDFSGYSDMAIGLGKMFGFNFPENFHFPYISKSIREFWRRWHITLSRWFKDYLYISLGGNRKGKNRTYVNLFIVFLLTGIWHGANWTFIVWGLIHGFFIILERTKARTYFLKTPVCVSHTYLILIVMLSWVMFRADSISNALNYYDSLFSFSKTERWDYFNFYFGTETKIAMILAFIFSFPILKIKFIKRFLDNLKPTIILSFKNTFLFLLFAIDIVYVLNESYNPFIYFRF